MKRTPIIDREKLTVHVAGTIQEATMLRVQPIIFHWSLIRARMDFTSRIDGKDTLLARIDEDKGELRVYVTEDFQREDQRQAGDGADVLIGRIKAAIAPHLGEGATIIINDNTALGVVGESSQDETAIARLPPLAIRKKDTHDNIKHELRNLRPGIGP